MAKAKAAAQFSSIAQDFDATSFLPHQLVDLVPAFEVV